MGRKKPFSQKQKKAQLQTTRARKRGDEEEDGRPAAGTTRQQQRRLLPSRSAPKGPTLRLESRFISLPPHYLERTRDLAFSTPLERPLPGESAVFPVELVTRSPATGKLVIPARPKFRYGQTKKEVEKNEEGVYKKWLGGTRATLDEYVLGEGDDGWPVSPSWFETNLEVWRQLWRVTESSAILLLLIDARCPPLHCPPSLRTYVKALKPRKEVILVLTKADLVDAGALAGWRTWLEEWWTEGDEPGAVSNVQVVAVSSYDKALLYGEGRARHRPAIPISARGELVEAIKAAHARLVTPPSWAGDDWKPAVRASVDWGTLESEPDVAPIQSGGRRKVKRDDAEDDGEGADGAESEEESEAEEPEAQHHRDPQTEPLPIGLIGQPNVGKSSLLNALLGTTRVRASKTPGKTKHFQTILWGPARDIKIIDCPGLVCPSLVPMELQAMAGILPISQIPSLPSCIYYVATRMPIEDVFRVPPPAEEEVVVDKRTWRGEGPRAVEAKGHTWTAGGIMEARAVDRGFLTAKGGRPDTNRAGNAMLRTIADGRVRWGFWPPGSSEEALAAREGKGVWLENTPELEDEEAGGERSEESDESEDDEASGVGAVPGSDNAEEEEEDESESEPAGFAVQNTRSFFNALSLEGSDESETEESESDDSLPPHTPS